MFTYIFVLINRNFFSGLGYNYILVNIFNFIVVLNQFDEIPLALIVVV